MKEIKTKFYLIRSDNKYCGWGDYVCLCQVIKGRNYKRNDILRAFNKLVSRDEYDWNERKEYQDYLCQITQITKK